MQLVSSVPYTPTKKTPQQHSLYSVHAPDALRCNAEHVCCDTAQQSATTHIWETRRRLLDSCFQTGFMRFYTIHALLMHVYLRNFHFVNSYWMCVLPVEFQKLVYKSYPWSWVRCIKNSVWYLWSEAKYWQRWAPLKPEFEAETHQNKGSPHLSAPLTCFLSLHTALLSL